MTLSARLIRSLVGRRWAGQGWFRLIALIGLIHGLIYVFVVPPWEHYDEPGHFEYAWLAANRPGWPQVGDFDHGMQEKLIESMKRAGFYDGRMDPPDLSNFGPQDNLYPAYSQVGDPFFYYWLVSLPLRLLKNAPFETQLIAGRLVSIVFLLLTLWAARQMMLELTAPGSALRWMVPLFLALFPGLVEFMSGLSNVTAAIGLVSVWLWLAVRLIRSGPAWKELLALLGLTWLCYETQKTAWVVLPLLPLALGLTFLRRRRWVLAPLGLAILLALGLSAFSAQGDPRYWIRRVNQAEDLRVVQAWNTRPEEQINVMAAKSGFEQPQTGLEIASLPLDEWQGSFEPIDAGVYQLLPFEMNRKLVGQEVTLGMWIWAQQPTRIIGPGLNGLCRDGDHWLGFETWEIRRRPRFFSLHITLPDDPSCRFQIWLRPLLTSEQTATMVYYSGVTLVKGSRPLDREPEFTAADGSIGRWGWTFENLARNPFAQQGWPRALPWAEQWFMKIGGVTPSTVPSTVSLWMDPGATAWYLRGTTTLLFRSFWAAFGWGQIELAKIPGLPFDAYAVFLVFSLLGVVGCATWLARCRRSISWEIVIFLALAVLTNLALTYFYGLITMGGALRFRAYIPVARYVYPVVIVWVGVLLAGWREGWFGIARYWRLSAKYGFILFGIVVGVFDVYALYTVMCYHH